MRAILLMGAGAAAAKSTPDAIQLCHVNFTATLRSRVYAWDWFQRSGDYENLYGYSANLLRLNFNQTRGALDLDAEIAAPFLLGMPDRATAPAPQGALGLRSNYYSANGNSGYSAMAIPKQLYARYHFGRKESSSVQAAHALRGRHGDHAERWRACCSQARSHQPAPDRNVRFLGCGPQLRRMRNPARSVRLGPQERAHGGRFMLIRVGFLLPRSDQFRHQPNLVGDGRNGDRGGRFGALG